MADYLDRLKLRDHLTVELDVLKSDFVNKLQRHVQPAKIGGLFADSFDVFSSSKKDYKGEVTSAGFEIKRRAKFFEQNNARAVAKGSYKQVGDKLEIQVEIGGFDKTFIIYFVVVTLFYVFFLGMGGFFWSLDTELSFFPFIFIPFHALMMYGIPILLMRKSVTRMKRDLEREFVFIASK